MSAIGRRLTALETAKRATEKQCRVVYVYSEQSEEEQEAAIDRQLAEQGATRDGTDLVIIVRFVSPAPLAA